MNNIIQITDRLVGDETIQTVDARELHRLLGIGKDFSSWIKVRIEQYGFFECHNSMAFNTAPPNGGVGNRGFLRRVRD